MQRILKHSFLLWLLIFSFPTQATEDIWPNLKTNYFADKPIHDANDWLLLLSPEVVEDSSIVPVSITSLKPQTEENRIKTLYLFIDKNPVPLAAKFDFSSSLPQIDIATRVRVNKFSDIRAIAEMNDGSLHMANKFLQADGGCSAPATKDYSASLHRLGKMQIRMRKPTIGIPTKVQVMISHPNNSGLQVDLATRGYIPAHFVKEMTISYKKSRLITMHSGISLSEDPSLRFLFTPDEHAPLEATVIDSKGFTYKREKHI